MDVATRCGQDSDCNPASAAGILGVMYGYEAIPEVYKASMSKVEDIDFAYTSISLNKVYGINLSLIQDIVEEQGGSVVQGTYTFNVQEPREVAREESFEGIEPSEKRVLKKMFNDSLSLDFEGSGVVVLGQITQVGFSDLAYVAQLEAYIDGVKVESFRMPFDYIKRKYDVFYKYGLNDGPHRLILKVLNPVREFVIETKEMVVYSDEKE